ncbi:hypothetical protein F750_5763 [Streptomyces sp. PAMC 26508]|nr:hypothetical protein F750_5763 [Streptomyces sp. PAMC 26508]
MGTLLRSRYAVTPAAWGVRWPSGTPAAREGPFIRLPGRCSRPRSPVRRGDGQVCESGAPRRRVTPWARTYRRTGTGV